MRVLQVNARAPERALLQEAATVLRRGGLVAFPTETVYGLGANALDADAVDRIYQAKGRPPANPIIVHVANVAAARALAAEWPDAAEKLAATYWPGPLTLVVRRTPAIPDIVTAGGDTVGLRVPGHLVALQLLEAADLPVAAPSANRSNTVSPTQARHVIEGLGDRVDLIIDGGPTTIGIESTVVDVTGAVPRVLRPGMITRHAIARVAGSAEMHTSPAQDGALRSPGLLRRHYSPLARVCLFQAVDRDRALAGAAQDAASGRRVGALLLRPFPTTMSLHKTIVMPDDADGYARALYAALHDVDDAGCDDVFVELPPDTPEWAGVLDRLRRAAS